MAEKVFCYVDCVNLIGNAIIKRQASNIAIHVGIVNIYIHKSFPPLFATSKM